MLRSFQINLRRTIYTGSVGKVVATYIPRDSLIKPRFWTNEGVNFRLQGLKTYFKNIFGLFYVQKQFKEFSKKTFLQEIEVTYRDFVGAFYKHDFATMRTLTTPDLFYSISSKMRKSKSVGGNLSCFKLDARPSIVQIVPVKLSSPNPIDIAQISVRFEYTVNSVQVKDFVVFERSATASNSKWRVCGRIDVQT